MPTRLGEVQHLSLYLSLASYRLVGNFSQGSIFVDGQYLPFRGFNFRGSAYSCTLFTVQLSLFRGFNLRLGDHPLKLRKLDPSNFLAIWYSVYPNFWPGTFLQKLGFQCCMLKVFVSLNYFKDSF